MSAAGKQKLLDAIAAGKGFFEKIAARLSEDLTDRNRVELDVPRAETR